MQWNCFTWFAPTLTPGCTRYVRAGGLYGFDLVESTNFRRERLLDDGLLDYVTGFVRAFVQEVQERLVHSTIWAIWYLQGGPCVADYMFSWRYGSAVNELILGAPSRRIGDINKKEHIHRCIKQQKNRRSRLWHRQLTSCAWVTCVFEFILVHLVLRTQS